MSENMSLQKHSEKQRAILFILFTEANEKFSKEIADIRGALEKGEDVSKKYQILDK